MLVEFVKDSQSTEQPSFAVSWSHRQSHIWLECSTWMAKMNRVWAGVEAESTTSLAGSSRQTSEVPGLVSQLERTLGGHLDCKTRTIPRRQCADVLSFLSVFVISKSTD